MRLSAARRRSIFKRATLFSLLSLIPLIGFWIYQVCVLRQSDLKLYQNMVRRREIASSNQPSPTNQHRKEVQKDIWFSQDDHSRLHYRIASQCSILTLTPIKNKFEVVESLDGIKCWMQDKLFHIEETQEPMQQTRYFEAKDGLYRYTTQEFTANGIALSLFRLCGHSLPNHPIDEKQAFLQGVAQNISLIFCGKTPQFQAEQFKATVIKEE